MNKVQNYHALNAALDEVLAALQQTDIGVDEAVKLYEKGLQLVTQLETDLSQAENTIEKLTLADKERV